MPEPRAVPHTVRRTKVWFVKEIETKKILRGPYKHSETAAAVRAEMEKHLNKWQAENWNLWIVWEWSDHA